MLTKLPIVGLPITFNELFYAFKHTNDKSVSRKFSLTLSQFVQSRYCIFTGSGKAAFYVILRCLSRLSTKKEVVLPAYTDAGLILVIQKVGLKPVLCDISLDTFNLDPVLLSKIVSENTLCIVPVHMFGLACDLELILNIVKGENIFVVEDCAQAFGTKIGGKILSTIGDIGFHSFNRGKNFPTYSGGCIVTNSEGLGDAITGEIKLLDNPNLFFKISLPIKLIGLSLAVKPKVYRFFYPFIAPFKSNKVPSSFSILRYTNFQEALGLSLLRRMDEFSSRRYDNGMILINGLKDIRGITLPKILSGSIPAFNRFPIVFKDIGLREKVYYRLLRNGIETSYMYLKPLHHTFGLGYKKEDFPNATYFAEHLLTLPVHPLVRKDDLLRMMEIIGGMR